MPVVVAPSTPSASTASSQGRDAGLILQSFLRECGDKPPDPILAADWLNDRYRQIWASVPWEFARKEAVFQTVNDITSNSVTVTNNSLTVTETTSDSKWTSAVIGRKFRAGTGNQFYTISNYANLNPDTLTLDRVFEGATKTLSAYRIYQNVYSLNAEVGQLLSLFDSTNQVSLELVSQQELDEGFPNRSGVGIPKVCAPAGRDANDIQQIELYPAPDDVFGIAYRYIQEAPFIVGGEAKIVPQVFQSLLKQGWLAEYWGWRSSMADATGGELNQANRRELMFMNELSQMLSREIQNMAPKRMQIASRYTRHRMLRGRGKFLTSEGHEF